MKILLLTDRLNWAYSSISTAIIKYNTDSNIKLDQMHIKGNVKNVKKQSSKYDLILVMGFQTYEKVSFLPQKQIMVGIHSAHSWDNKETTPDHDAIPPKKLIDFLNGFLRVNTVSKRLYNLFKQHGLIRLYLTENGVDANLFKPGANLHDGFIVGYSGSTAHDWRKGTTDYILPAAKKAGVKTHLAMLSTGSHVPLDEMPKFYHHLDAYICASQSEGFSLSVLEAASCGKPVISTRVGGCTDLIQDGYNGFLVDREIHAIAEKIVLLKKDRDLYDRMSTIMRNRVVEHYSWSKQVKAWISFLKGT